MGWARWVVEMVVHMTGSFIPVKNEEVKVGDACFLTHKGVSIEAAVVKRQGRRIKLMPEDRSGEMWVAPEELDKVKPGGAEELMSRAAREAEKKAREEAARKAEADRKAAEKAEKDTYDTIQSNCVSTIQNTLNMRAVPSREWCPVGKYCWTESPVLMDQTKDCYRVVWYEIDVDKDYGGVHEPPEIDLSEVDEIVAAIEARKKEAAEAAKKAPKARGKPKKKTDEEVAAEEAAKAEEEAKDQAEQDVARKRAENAHAAKLDLWKRAEAVRTPVKPPLYPPDLPPVLEPPQHPANQKRYDELLKQGRTRERDRTRSCVWAAPHLLPCPSPCRSC